MDDDSDHINDAIYTGKAPAGSDVEILMSPRKGGKPPSRTCATLRLNLEEAAAGRTWLLLPEGFRDKESGSTYPLPTLRTELQKLSVIPILPDKRDCGSVYIRRAIDIWKKRQAQRVSAIHDMERRETKIRVAEGHLSDDMKRLRNKARKAVDEVRQEAAQAIASLNDLFSLGRQGIEGQMRAHLDGKKWQGEDIDADAFRQCFRLVSQAVKGLGLPTEQRDKAREAVMEEVAASMRDTQETIALAPGSEPEETEH